MAMLLSFTLLFLLGSVFEASLTAHMRRVHEDFFVECRDASHSTMS